MKSGEIFLPMSFFQLLAVRIKHLMQQHIASLASLHHFIGGCGISRNHNLPIASLKLISIGLFPYSMLNRKRSDRNILVAINHSRLDLMNIDLVTGSIRPLPSALA